MLGDGELPKMFAERDFVQPLSTYLIQLELSGKKWSVYPKMSIIYPQNIKYLGDKSLNGSESIQTFGNDLRSQLMETLLQKN